MMAEIDSRIALGLRPMEFQSPLASAGKALSLRSMLDERAVRAMQMERMQQADMQRQQRDAQMQQIAQRLPPEERDAFMVNPQEFIKQKYAAFTLGPNQVRHQGNQVIARGPAAQYTLGPGQVRFEGADEVASLPANPTLHNIPVPGRPGVEQPTWLRPGETQGAPVGGLRMPDILSPEVQAAKQKVAAAGASRITNVNNVQGREADKAYGKFVGEAFADIQKAGLAAPAEIGRYRQLENLLKQVGTGKFAGTTTELKAAAKGLGVDLNALGVRDDVAPAQAAKALSSQMALELRNRIRTVSFCRA
jgi:hypothetical protein